MPLPLKGSLPKFWDWLPQAKDAGHVEYMNTVVDVWAGMDAVSVYCCYEIQLLYHDQGILQCCMMCTHMSIGWKLP